MLAVFAGVGIVFIAVVLLGAATMIYLMVRTTCTPRGGSARCRLNRGGFRMRRGRHERFSVFTSRGIGSYGSRSKAISAARWVAQGSGGTVSVINETTGQMWEMPAPNPSGVPA